jgi:hypothetical protein
MQTFATIIRVKKSDKYIYHHVSHCKQLAKIELLNSFRDPRTPERDRQSERECQRLNQLQMTSPSIRRQREYDRQQPIPQPNFGVSVNVGNMGLMVAGPPAPIEQRVNWNERLEQNFQGAHARQLQNHGGQRRGQNEEMPIVAGPSVPQEERVNWQERLEQGFQARHAQRLQNRGGSLWE